LAHTNHHTLVTGTTDDRSAMIMSGTAVQYATRHTGKRHEGRHRLSDISVEVCAKRVSQSYQRL